MVEHNSDSTWTLVSSKCSSNSPTEITIVRPDRSTTYMNEESVPPNIYYNIDINKIREIVACMADELIVSQATSEPN